MKKLFRLIRKKSFIAVHFLIINLLYPFFFFISLIFSRNKKIWVFGYARSYNDNTKYFFEYASQQNEFDCYWLANNKKELFEVKSLGYKAVLKKSFYGYFLSARANLSFIAQGYSDVNRLLALNSYVINFWHGTPIKKIYLDSEYDLNKFGNNKIARYLTKSLLKFLTSRFAFYYASNKLERKLVCASANISVKKSKVLGSPRFDKLLKNPNIKKLKQLKNDFDKIILYAPTWRENAQWIHNFNIKDNEYFLLNKKLQTMNALLIIKPHPITDKEELLSLNLLESKNIVYSNSLEINDINDLYFYSDLLITDVSSAMFDFMIFNRKTIIFMPDANQYLTKHRGIYSYFEETLNKYAIQSWDSLSSSLDKSRQDIPILKDIRKELSTFKQVNQAIYNDLLDRFYEK